MSPDYAAFISAWCYNDLLYDVQDIYRVLTHAMCTLVEFVRSAARHVYDLMSYV